MSAGSIMIVVPESKLKQLVFFIWKFIRIQRMRFFLVFLLSLAWSLDSTVWPYLLRSIIDAFTLYDGDRTQAWPLLRQLLVSLGVLWLCVESGFRGKDFLMAVAFPKLESDIRIAMFDHVQHHSPKYFTKNFAGSLANKISDMPAHVSIIMKSLLMLFPTLVTCFITIILFFQIHALFAWILTVWIVLHFSITWAFAPKCAGYANVHGEARSSLSGKIVDSLTNNFSVNLFSRFHFEMQRINLKTANCAIFPEVPPFVNYRTQD